MINKKVTIIDYGMGNIWSVLNAFRYIGTDPQISTDPVEIARSEMLVLPGVGSYRKAMERIRSSGFDKAIYEAVKKRGRKIIGICLGMQLLGTKGTEDGESLGLGLVPTMVDAFHDEEIGKKKVPHIGFNQVELDENSALFQGLPNKSEFYFVHSYRMLPDGLPGIITTCSYGIDFLASYEYNNIFATQFHPEKSQTNGLILLNNFINI